MLGGMIAWGVAWFYKQEVLVSSGFSEYGYERKKVDIELVNTGRSDIRIQEVRVNGRIDPEAQLVISHSLQLVAGGIDESPTAEFLAFGEKPIHPELPVDEKQEAALAGKPTLYGIRVESDETIATVEVKYNYYGRAFTFKIDLDTWPQ